MARSRPQSWQIGTSISRSDSFSLSSPLASPPFSPSVGSFSPTFSDGGARELEDVQERTFCKWLNAKLEVRSIPPMHDLGKDLSDGVKLLQLMEIMGNTSLGRFNLRPKLRVQKAENVVRALDFIRSRGVILTNIGPEDIIDGNRKLILGMIWTLILRFTIADINEEGLSAKEGLLLWCQRKTQGYSEVDVQDFSNSWKDGLALCALIHRHRPDLLDYNALDKSNPHANTKKAFSVAEHHLGIPQLLEVSDLCDSSKPDERSVMTYVAQFFHAFSSMNKTETEARRVATFAEHMQSVWLSMNDYERRMKELVTAITSLLHYWSTNPPSPPYASLKAASSSFTTHKQSKKRDWVAQKSEITALLGNIAVKLKTYNLKSYVPPEGCRLSDLDAVWESLLQGEANRSREINAKIRQIKEELRKKFADLANGFERELQRISLELGELEGTLESQLDRVKAINARLPRLSKSLEEISAAEQECNDANVEENDYTVYTFEDLDFEFGWIQQSVSKKMAFIENQIVSRNMTNLTPVQLEEFESTFRFFDKDQSNTLDINEFAAALASLSIVYTDTDIENIHQQLAGEDERITFESFISFLVEITEDTTSPEQVRESFRGIAGDKPYVTELDLKLSQIPQGAIDYLCDTMPRLEIDPPPPNTNGASEGEGEGPGVVLDFDTYLTEIFA